MGDLAVFFECECEDEDVVQVDGYLSFGDEIREYGVHEGLESSGGVGETEEHDLRFEETLVGGESSFPFIAFLDSDVVVTPSYVELGEVARSLQSVDDVSDQGEWVAILDCVLVETSIVLDKAERSILLFDEEDGGSNGGLGGTNQTTLEVLLEKAVQFYLFVRREGVDLGA